MSLQLPNKDWKYNDWVDYVIKNKLEVFGEKKEKNLKVYYVHCTDQARDVLREKSQAKGDFDVIAMPYQESASRTHRSSEYWMHEKEPGLLMFFTSSTREGYEKTLKNYIDNSVGLHEMWIKPDTFDRTVQYLTTEKGCGISKFIASRTKDDILKHKVPEEARRRVQYRTSNLRDGINRLEDFRQTLGVRPHSINYVYNGQTIQITDLGLFHLKTVTRDTVDLMHDVIDMVRDEEKEMREFAQALKFVKTSDGARPFESVLESGKISLNIELDTNQASDIIEKFQSRFAFIDPVVERDGSLMFYSTIVDRQKGSVFNISGNKSSILLIPKFRVTFETFITFYKYVVEQVDGRATWAKLSDIVEPT